MDPPLEALGRIDWHRLPVGTNRSIWFDTWVVVFEQNVTSVREMVFHPKRLGVVVFGAVLSVWIILCNLLVTIALFKKRKYERIRSTNLLIFNFVGASFLVGTFVVPLNVNTEHTGRWAFGPQVCRSWLLGQILLGALCMWSCFMVTVDRLIYVSAPHAYLRRMTRYRLAVLVILSWVFSLGAVVPPALAIHEDSDIVLDELCAISLHRPYAIAVSSIAFFVPAGALIIVSMAVAIVALKTQRKSPNGRQAGDAQTLFQAKSCNENAYVYIDYQSVGNAALSTAIVNIVLVALAGPFYVLNVWTTFCEGLCVDPAIWSLCVWLGYAAAGVCPALWFLDTQLRQNFKDMLRCRKDVVHYDGPVPDNGNWAQEAETFKPYMYLKH